MIRLDDFPSRHVPPRRVDIWLPPGYGDGPQRYPVVYLHDGQNCFVPGDSNFGVAWETQNALLRLVAAGETAPAILVGVWSIEQRRLIEYRPARPFLYLSEQARRKVTAGMGGMPQSDDYLAFIVEELKPYVDSHYRTRPGRDRTMIMGSSMGGLISLYALCEYPDVFGGAGCVSTHWPAVEGVIMPYLRDHLPAPADHRVYFDYGTETIDVLYGPTQQLVDSAMAAAGYEQGRNWITRVFPGTRHFEADWQQRVHIPLRFLLSGAAHT
jgi:predicted alpha/beta superfamily hydrolase